MMRPESMSLKKLGGWWAVISSPPLQPFSLKANTFTGGVRLRNVKGVQRLSRRGGVLCGARRRAVRYGEEEYGHNEEIAMLEFYSQSAKGEALIVHAVVDDEEVQVLIFKVSFFFFFLFAVNKWRNQIVLQQMTCFVIIFSFFWLLHFYLLFSFSMDSYN